MIYCPYTDREIPEADTSPEHIIPLALGGCDKLTIPVDSGFNANLGSELDGALANDFIVAFRRTEYDARGHSQREPWAVIKDARYGEDDRPAQVRFHKHRGLRIWDARDRKLVGGKQTIQVRASVSIDLPVRFAAKVALAAGYYTYGDLFRRQVDHAQLRAVMNTDPAKLDLTKGAAALGLDHLTIRVDNYMWQPPADPGDTITVLRALCQSVRGSCVAMIRGRDSLGFAVGVLGGYVAMVNAPADVSALPNADHYAWGHVLAVVAGRLERLSLRAALLRFAGLPDPDAPSAS